MSESSESEDKVRRMRMVSLTVLGLVGAVLIVVGVAVSWQRTLIPGAFDGTAGNIETFEVDQPGIDDWVSLSIDDREITTGNDALMCLREGSTVTKSSFSHHMYVDEESCDLPFPRQAVTDTVVPLLLTGILASFVLSKRRHRNAGLLLGGDS